MNCKKVRQMLTAYISDELDRDERRDIETHLQMCPSCQRELNFLQATKEMLGMWVEVDPPEELSQRLEVRLAEEVQKGEAKSFIPFRRLPLKWIHVSATAVCFITAVILGFYILLSREGTHLRPLPRGESTSSPRAVYDAYRQGDVWVSFYISEHEKTLKHATLQKATALPREIPIRVPFRRENILYYDEISEGSEELEGKSGLIVKSENGWEKEESAKEDAHKEILIGEPLTLEEARKSVSFDIIAPAVIRGEYHLDMVRKAKDKECVQLVYSNGLSVISLFEQPLEAREKLDRGDFREYILRLAKNEGRMAVLGWVTEQLFFNITGEMALSELMEIAEEIHERRLTDEARSYYQMLYGGDEYEKIH